MWIVTAQAIRRLEWLVLMRLLQVVAFYVVAIDAKRWGRLGEMIVELSLAHLTRFVRDVAGVAAHVEGCMPAAFLGNIEAGRVATKAEVFFLVA